MQLSVVNNAIGTLFTPILNGIKEKISAKKITISPSSTPKIAIKSPKSFISPAGILKSFLIGEKHASVSKYKNKGLKSYLIISRLKLFKIILFNINDDKIQ